MARKGLIQKSININGKRKYFYGKTEKEVLKKILEYQGEVEKGRTFKAVADEWSSIHFETIAYNSLKNYKPAFKRVVDKFNDVPIKKITPQQIKKFIDDFSYKGYALKTVKTQLLVTNLIFKYAVVSGDIEYNPAREITVPKNLRKTKRDLPTEKEIETVKNSVNSTFGLFPYFLLYTGCRKGEALALEVKDIDLKNNVIHINKSLYHENNRPRIKTPKTEAGIRDVILVDKLKEKLKNTSGKLLFPNDKGELMTETQFQRQWELYQKETCISVTPHQLRHAYATLLFEAGIDVKDAQELLGHSSIDVTRNIYTHISKSRKQLTAEKLNNYL